MKASKIIFILFIATGLYFSGCKSMNKSQKGAVVGTTAGGAAGAVIGRASGNTALGAVIGATVGGVSGAVIGRQMDKQAEEIRNEIPGVTVERVGEGIVIEFSDNILFEFDSHKTSSAAEENLDKLITILNKYPETNIEVHGHTDSRGSRKYNQNLSEQRAVAVTTYLANNNIAADRLSKIGFGEDEPKYDNDTEEGRSKNRRVEFAITANETMIESAN